jgi:putative tricarboxylic transport membrane protein
MDTLTAMQQGFLAALQWQSILMMVLGTIIGTAAGIIPGLSSGMSVALLLPLTFTMAPLHGIIFLISVFVAVGYGGALTAILLNTPGSPQNTVTALDGFALTKSGRAGYALGVSISSSVYGGLMSYFAMLFSIGFVAAIALKFGPVELFLIAIAGVAILGAVGSGSAAKTTASGAFGLLVGTIGIVPTGEWRATFNDPFLADGVPIVPVMIGMFVFSELMLMTFREYVVDSTIAVKRSVRDILSGFRLPRHTMPALMRSSGLGIIVGLLPAAGGTVASFSAYSLAKRTSKRPQEYGKGSVEGVVAAESANNACSGGDIMTTLVLGVPGSATTGILLGALTMHGLQAGPNFVAQQQELVYGIVAAAIISQIFMVAAAVIGAYSLSGTLSIPTRYLVPVLAMFSVVGAFASRNAAFDVYLMLICGALGYLMKRTGYSPAAFVMGVILSSIADNELIRTIQLYGDEWYWAFVSRPLAAGILLLLLSTFLWSGFGRLLQRRRSKHIQQGIDEKIA